MKKLDITKIEMVKGKTLVHWHRYNDDNADNDSSSIWEITEGVEITGVLEFARAHTDADIEINLNLN